MAHMKKPATQKLALLGFIAALFTSCLPVPFDLGISQAVATAAKMTRDNSGVITARYNQGGSPRDFAFYPQVAAAGGFDYSAGIVTALDGSSIEMQAVAGGVTYAGWSQPILNPDPHAPVSLGWPVKSGASYLFGIVFDALNPAMGSGYALFKAIPPGMFTVVASSSLLNLLLLLGSSTTVIGASVSASPSGGLDMLHVLGVSATSFQEAVFQLQSTGIVASSVPRASSTLSFIPTGITRVMYFYDENASGDPGRIDNRSFAAWYDQPTASWVSYAWWEQPTGSGTLFSMRLPVSHRLDVLLSTGQLLSTEDGTGRLYDRDGNLLATFPLGNLVYVAEEYVGGVPRCYFSRCLVYDNQLHFDVYWIETSKVATLAN